MNLSAAVLRNHKSNDLGVWYEDRSIYLVVLLCVYFEVPIVYS